MKLLFNGCVFSQQIPRPGERERGRFMAGKKQSHHFITKLTISHLAAIFIAHREQGRKQIAFVRAAGVAFRDDAINYPVDLFREPVKVNMVGSRQAIVQNPFQSRLPGERFH